MSSALIALLIQIITFAAVVGVSMSVIGRFTTQMEVRRRLNEQVRARPVARTDLLKKEGVKSPFLLWVQRSTSLEDSKDGQQLRRDLSKAGIEHPAGPALYVVARFTLAIGLPLGFVALQQISSKPITGIPFILGALALCGLGLIAPKAVLDNRVNARKEQLEQEFPDALDLMVVCVEAGLGLESALVRVGREVGESHPRICEEFERVTQELAAGRGRADALRAMADRTDVDSVKSFVALLIQTDTLGASIGQTLRTYSNEMREHRFLKAEEKAMRIPVLMTIPLVACILPVIITALMLPAIIDVIRNLLPALSGQGH
ncbi:MAG TPA: type II secretion system F family protein [Phenylobacterium sp.]|nr:type II secretion system F family protein [Phenylobacterium sp.]